MIHDQLSRFAPEWKEYKDPIPIRNALFNPLSYLNETHSEVNDIIRGLLGIRSITYSILYMCYRCIVKYIL